MPRTEPEYILGTHDAEAARLGLQHRLWSDAAHALWRRAGILPGHRVLDVGCGPGFASFDLAQIAGSVVGVDESPRYVEQAAAGAKARGVTAQFLKGDVQQLGKALQGELPFDLAYARWVLCFVPDPEAVVAGVAAALNPGGRFVVSDYFAYESLTLAPRAPHFDRVIRAVGASWRSRGGDPDVVGRLPAMFRKHGLELTHLDIDHRIARPGNSMWTWPDTFFRGYVPLLVSGGFMTQLEADEWLAEWEARAKNPDTFLLLPPVFDVVGVKR